MWAWPIRNPNNKFIMFVKSFLKPKPGKIIKLKKESILIVKIVKQFDIMSQKTVETIYGISMPTNMDDYIEFLDKQHNHAMEVYKDECG